MRKPKRLKHLTRNTEKTIFKLSKSKRKRKKTCANKLQLRKRSRESKLLTRKLKLSVKKEPS
jgi:hypothetical protein